MQVGTGHVKSMSGCNDCVTLRAVRGSPWLQDAKDRVLDNHIQAPLPRKAGPDHLVRSLPTWAVL